jgi:hypothetical protein
MQIDELKSLAKEIREKHSVSPQQLLVLSSGKLSVPIGLFSDRRLGILETLVKYMKEELGMPYCEIARSLDRDQRTVWATYDKAAKKAPGKLPSERGAMIPIEIFKDRTQGVLETLCKYAHEDIGMNHSQIARAIGRDPRTIWTVNNRKHANTK